MFRRPIQHFDKEAIITTLMQGRAYYPRASHHLKVGFRRDSKYLRRQYTNQLGVLGASHVMGDGLFADRRRKKGGTVCSEFKVILRKGVQLVVMGERVDSIFLSNPLRPVSFWDCSESSRFGDSYKMSWATMIEMGWGGASFSGAALLNSLCLRRT